MISWTWHKTHQPEFGAYGGGWAVFYCKKCHVDNMPGSFRWHLRCRSNEEITS